MNGDLVGCPPHRLGAAAPIERDGLAAGNKRSIAKNMSHGLELGAMIKAYGVSLARVPLHGYRKQARSMAQFTY